MNSYIYNQFLLLYPWTDGFCMAKDSCILPFKVTNSFHSDFIVGFAFFFPMAKLSVYIIKQKLHLPLNECRLQ